MGDYTSQLFKPRELQFFSKALYKLPFIYVYDIFQFTSQLSGNDVTMAVETKVDGNLNLDPIQGDMLCTYSNLPQVTVSVNDIPSQCNVTPPATGCSFQWDAASTPTINSCSQSELHY